MNNVSGLITANFRTDDLKVLTDDRGVASLPYGGRYRLIDFPLSNMVNSGLFSIGLITPPKFRSVIDHIGSGSNWMLDRKRGGLYILPGSAYGSATQGARFMLRDMIQNRVFFNRSHSDYVLVTAATIISNMDYNPLVEAHIASGADVTMACKKAVRSEAHMLNVKEEDGKVKSYSYGVEHGDTAFIDTFVINRDLLMQLMDWYEGEDSLDFFDILEKELHKYTVKTWMYEGYAREIFSIPSYLEASRDLLNMDINEEIFNEKKPIRTKVQDSAPSKIYGNAKVKNSLVSSGCVVTGTVEDSILFRGVIVQEGAIVKDSVIMQSCVIETGAVVENAIIDRNNKISGGITLRGTKDAPFVLAKSEKPVKKQ